MMNQAIHTFSDSQPNHVGSSQRSAAWRVAAAAALPPVVSLSTARLLTACNSVVLLEVICLHASGL